MRVYEARARERRAFYLLAANSGLRWREVARLRWADVDLDGQTVTVPAGQTKNGAIAKLPLLGAVVDALRELRPADADLAAHVFRGEPTLKTWKHDLRRAGLIGRAEVEDEDSEKAQAAEDDPQNEGYVDERGRRLDRKCLRMSFCTWLKQRGVDLRDAQRLMRHSDPELTARTYADLRMPDLRAALEKGLTAPTPAVPLVREKTA